MPLRNYHQAKRNREAPQQVWKQVSDDPKLAVPHHDAGCLDYATVSTSQASGYLHISSSLKSSNSPNIYLAPQITMSRFPLRHLSATMAKKALTMT
eukprot:2340973-Amphidinium_carterae.1